MQSLMPLTTFTKEAKVMIEKTRDATHFDNRVFSGMIFYLWCRYDRCKSQSSTDVVNYIYYLYIKSCTSISYLLMFHRSRKSKEKSVFTMIFNVVFLLFPQLKTFLQTLFWAAKGSSSPLFTHARIGAILSNCKLQ